MVIFKETVPDSFYAPRLPLLCRPHPFVLQTEATGTNNEAEQSLCPMAQDRRTGRTSKTLRGARRLKNVSIEHRDSQSAVNCSAFSCSSWHAWMKDEADHA